MVDSCLQLIAESKMQMTKGLAPNTGYIFGVKEKLRESLSEDGKALPDRVLPNHARSQSIILQMKFNP